MANNGNLIIPTSEQARENGRKGGIASAKAKEKRKMIKQQMELLLELPLKSEKTKKQLQALGINDDEMTNQMAMIIALWQKALKGDVQAFNTFRDTIGEKPIDKVEQVNPPVIKIERPDKK